MECKQRQKAYKDSKPYVKPHTINVGDTVLLKQRATKLIPPYDPEAYTVTDVVGHQITGKRGQQEKTRDAQKWKKVVIGKTVDYAQIRQDQLEKKLRDHYDGNTLDIGTSSIPAVVIEPQIQPPIEEEEEAGQRRPQREGRKMPQRFNDYVMSRVHMN